VPIPVHQRGALARRQIGRPFFAGLVDNELIALSRNVTTREADAVEASLRRAAKAVGYNVLSGGMASTDSGRDLELTFRHAAFAADLAALRTDGTTFVQWKDLGSWRLLYDRPLEMETVRELSDDAQRLLRRGTPEQWQTVIAYLDAGRSVSPACKALAVHRATLYYRLDRIRELLGPEALDDGWRATSLHVALKLHHALTHRGAGI
jgi:DNA-binding PucR family transcriptional regulator